MATINAYIPILRWRPAEIKALELLYSQDRKYITPLIEFVMPAPSMKNGEKGKVVTKTPKEKILAALPNVAGELLKACGNGVVFVDVHLIESGVRASSLEQILSSSQQLNLLPVPVIYIVPVTSTDADMQTRLVAVDYAKKSGLGICLRIDKTHLGERDLPSHINNFISDNGLDKKNIDLLVDLGEIQQTTTPEDIVKQLAQIPELEKWRSFIVSGGVFPKNLVRYPPGKVHELDRLDWKLWSSLQRTSLKRQPVFSDYTIQCPSYEPVSTLGSASVRYTDEDKWWIFRGKIPGLINRKTMEKGPGREQYIDHARTITGKSFSKFYKGSTYSFGDGDIARIAEPNNNKPGNSGTWLTIGINHHLTLVARWFANLSRRQ